VCFSVTKALELKVKHPEVIVGLRVKGVAIKQREQAVLRLSEVT
jgi:hypothetical protein